ncbi:MAG: glycosyltransferase [Ekhidna sp.]|nr:glycosyltransferase [Ekhidna sp.]
MSRNIRFSFIIPIYNRKDEVIELLESLALLSAHSFEVLLIDGSPTPVLEELNSLEAVKKLLYKRIHVPKLGISASRNLGAKNAKGEYLIFLDSDVILPSDYLENVEMALSVLDSDAFGGPDAAHPSFTVTQKAINYTMTSILTTGGLRGKGNVSAYRPRGFNFGVRKLLFDKLGGFNEGVSVGEDIDLSVRIAKVGASVQFIEKAFVYHKRRISLIRFYKQIFRFGAGRILLAEKFSEERKITFLLPLAFVLGVLSGSFLWILSKPLFTLWGISLSTYLLANLILATYQNKSIMVGLLVLPTLFVQFGAYAFGFVQNFISVYIKGRPDGIFTIRGIGPQSPV